MAGFVLNLIINGIPSILGYNGKAATLILESFKPYYKWNTFNTELAEKGYQVVELSGFKPYYKWNTFNTFLRNSYFISREVLNLIINGIPSIQKESVFMSTLVDKF